MLRKALRPQCGSLSASTESYGGGRASRMLGRVGITVAGSWVRVWRQPTRANRVSERGIGLDRVLARRAREVDTSIDVLDRWIEHVATGGTHDEKGATSH